MSSSIVREPLNFGGFLKLLVIFYKQFFLRGICYGLFAIAPSFIYAVIVGSIPKKDMTWDQFIFSSILALVGFLISNFGCIAICKVCSQHYLGEPVDWKVTNAVAKKNFWRFLSVSLINSLLICVMIICFTILVPLFGLAGFCIIIPAILALMNYAVTLPVIALEDKTVYDSLNRSRVLTYSNRWRILSYMSIFYGLPFFMSGLLITFFSASEIFSTAFNYTPYIFRVFFFPLIPLFLTLLYFDLYARKQGATPQNLQVVDDEAATV